MRSRSAAAAVVACAAVAFAGLAAWAAYARSAIPLAWHGTVTEVEARHEKHPGVDDAWFVTVGGGDAVHVDAAVARPLRAGDRVEKDRWSRTLLVNGEARVLRASEEARRLAVVPPVVAVAAALTAYARASWLRARTRSSRTAAR
jgi:hypothetical protein